MAKAVALASVGQEQKKFPAGVNQKNEANDNVAQSFTESTESKDYFIEKNGVKYAGNHLLLDFWGATNLDDMELMERAMREAVIEAKATLLHIHLHHFTPNGGISGVAVLAESHISVHTWPEKGFAAFDIFMCGESEPHKGAAVLEKYFRPSRVELIDQPRGTVQP